MHTQEELEVRKLWVEIRKWFKLNKSGDIKLFKKLYPEMYDYMKGKETQKNTVLSMECLKRVGEVVNRCMKSGNYIKTPDNDIIEYLYINENLVIDEIGTSFHPDIRKGSIYENDFEDPIVEEEMFGKPLFTINQKGQNTFGVIC